EPEFTSIALATGELYTTTELTTYGGAPRFSPDGRSPPCESGPGTRRRIRIASIEQPTTITMELPGFSVAFSPDGSQMAYLKITPTPELEQEQAALERAPAAERAQRLAV